MPQITEKYPLSENRNPLSNLTGRATAHKYRGHAIAPGAEIKTRGRSGEPHHPFPPNVESLASPGPGKLRTYAGPDCLHSAIVCTRRGSGFSRSTFVRVLELAHSGVFSAHAPGFTGGRRAPNLDDLARSCFAKANTVIERLRLLLRKASYNLRGGFLVRPVTIALVLGCAGAVLSWIEESNPSISNWAPRVLFFSQGDPTVAQVILSDIATSTMTVVSIVFAILLMTLTLASMQFSPRIIVSFARDRVTQWTLGIFLGTFLYCMAALPAAHSRPTPFAPVVTVMAAILLAILCVALLLFFIHHISQAISVNHIVDRIARETEAVIDEVMPAPRRDIHMETSDSAVPPVWDAPLLNDAAGYIRFVDLKQLLALATSHHLKIQVVRRVGQFVPAGTPLVRVNKADRVSPELASAFRGAFDLGPTRTLQQDIEFGVLQIVDIALKAISPAVNDPTTAVGCVDQLSRILIRFASREVPEPRLYDLGGAARVHIQWIDFEKLLESAFGQIRMYSGSDVAVSLRLLRALSDIAITSQDASYRRMLLDHGRRVVQGCSKQMGGEDLRNLNVRLGELETLVGNDKGSPRAVLAAGTRSV